MNATIELEPSIELASGEQLLELLRTRLGGMLAVWIDDEDAGALALFLNGERAWLTHLMPNGDPDVSSRGELLGDNSIEFRLENGQIDEMPADWTVPIEAALQAAATFVATGNLAENINWFED